MEIYLEAENKLKTPQNTFQDYNIVKACFFHDNVSLENCKRLTSTFASPNKKLLNNCFSTTCLISPLSSSATIRKRKGTKRSPCLKPLCGANPVVGLPLTGIDIVLDSKQVFIHPIPFTQKPSLFHNSWDWIIDLFIIYLENQAFILAPLCFFRHLISYQHCIKHTSPTNKCPLPPSITSPRTFLSLIGTLERILLGHQSRIWA